MFATSAFILRRIVPYLRGASTLRSDVEEKMSTLAAVPNEKNLIWIDMEMTGLDPQKDKIIEVACIVTGPNLTEVAEGPDVVVNCCDQLLDSMDSWCKKTHGQSGLTDKVRKSRLTVEEAEQQLLDFVTKYTPPGKCPLAGNSVHCDKAFLAVYMPRFVSHLHYRIVDVSTIKELVKRWYPNVSLPRKGEAHRALADIQESIAELRWYRENVFSVQQ